MSFAAPKWKQWLRARRLVRGIECGDTLKSWDVLRTAEFLEARVPKEAAVLDIGAYASEIPPILHRVGYRRVCGLDLNPDVVKMPFHATIDYRVGDFTHAPYPDGTFSAITAISVIEHGFDAPALLSEISRLLAPGGYFVASFDYWPDKIATDGITMFDMSWTIFSQPEIEQLLAQAAAYGLSACGPLQAQATSALISCAGKSYTFAWLALRKTQA